jgi:hypothetical protein
MNSAAPAPESRAIHCADVQFPCRAFQPLALSLSKGEYPLIRCVSVDSHVL